MLKQYANDLQDQQYEIQKNKELLNLKETRADMYARTEEELIAIISKLKLKLAKKKHKISVMENREKAN